MNLDELRNQTQRLETRLSLLEESQEHLADSLTVLKSSLSSIGTAQSLLKAAALRTQEHLAFNLSTITTASLRELFEEPYEFTLSFVEKRNKTEINYTLERDKLSLGNPLYSVGGGVIDVCAFSLRIACIILTGAKRTLILDEPLKNLSRNIQPDAGSLINELSEKLDLQFIIVTHEKALIENLDANIVTI